jgi:hypothetical protein
MTIFDLLRANLVDLRKRCPPSPESERIDRQLTKLAEEENKRKDEDDQSKD